MLQLADLATFATNALGAGTPVYINRMPDAEKSQDQICMVSIVHGGRGFLVDGAFQEVVVHTRVRAATDAEAETLALTLDAAMLNTTPFSMGAAYVRDVYPAGGPPCYFERDNENNTVYFCDYILEVSR